jgi:hypothetical protein
MNTLLIALGIFLAGFGAAWSWQGARGAAEIGTLKTKHEKEAGAAARTAAGDLKAAQDRADAIARAAAVRDATQDQKLQEAHHALKTATRNRPCLGGPALRLLGESPGLRLAPAIPAPAGPPDHGSAAPAADPADQGEHATDTQIADWIATAGTFYERCRNRIRDIRAWSEGS